jgi:hypothetical protein
MLRRNAATVKKITGMAVPKTRSCSISPATTLLDG